MDLFNILLTQPSLTHHIVTILLSKPQATALSISGDEKSANSQLTTVASCLPAAGTVALSRYAKLSFYHSVALYQFLYWHVSNTSLKTKYLRFHSPIPILDIVRTHSRFWTSVLVWIKQTLPSQWDMGISFPLFCPVDRGSICIFLNGCITSWQAALVATMTSR